MDTSDSTTKTKRCTKGDECVHPMGCLQPATNEYFPLNKRRTDGFGSWCKACQRVYNKKYNTENVEKLRQYRRRYALSNPEKVREYKRNWEANHRDELRERRRQRRSTPESKEKNRRYYTENIDKIKAYKRERYLKNKDKVREYGKRYRAEHAEKIKEDKQRYRAENIEKVRAYNRRWYAKNAMKVAVQQRNYRTKHPSKMLSYVHLRRARKLTVGGVYTPADIHLQLKSQRGLCWWCSKPLNNKYHIDHRIPLARGGSNAPANLCLACPKCNNSKGAKLPHEWNGRLL